MKVFRLAAAVVGSCAVLSSPLTALAEEGTSAEENPNIVTINLYTLTDVHGHIQLVEKKDKKTGEKKVTEAGLEKVGCFLDKKRAEHPDSSFTLLGDNIGASPFTSGSLKDNPTIASLNVLKPVASTIGNHELDLGQAVFKQRIDGTNTNEYVQVTFPYLGANVAGLGTWINKAGVKVPYLGEYQVWEAPDSKIKVAFIGAIAEDVPYKLSPDTTKGMTFHDPIAKVNTLAEKIKADGIAQIVVAMLDDDVKNNFPKMGAAVDAIMGGDTHVPYEFDAVDSAVKLKSANPLLAGVASGSYTDNMGLISLAYDKTANKVVKADAQLISAAQMEQCDTNSSSSAQTIKEIVEKAVADSKAAGAVPIVKDVKAEFRRGVFAAGAEKAPEPGSNRGIESTLGNLVADALRDQVITKTGKADIGIINAGGLREDLIPRDGTITYADTFAVMPFSNEVGYVTITGKDFVKALEEQWKTNLNSQNSRPMLKLGISSNVRYTYDPSKPAGARITSVMVNDQPIDLAKKYTVGSVTFLLAGGDSFDALKAGGKFVTNGFLDRDKFNDYLRNLGAAKIQPRAAKSAIGVTLDRDSVTNGESVQVTLRGLSYSEGSSITKNVRVSAGGAEVTAVVNNSLIEPNANNAQSIITTDGAGQAVLDVPVKALCPAHGGEVHVPLTVKTDFATVVSADQGVGVKVRCAPTANSATDLPAKPGDLAKQGDGLAKLNDAAHANDAAPTPTLTKDGQQLASTGANIATTFFTFAVIALLGVGACAVSRRK